MKMITFCFPLFLLVLLWTACGDTNNTTVPDNSGQKDLQVETITAELNDKIAQGGYLVRIMGCSDCHTPFKMTEQGPAPDMDRFLAGHPSEVPLPAFDPAVTRDYVLFNMTNTAAIGPWGTSFSANLTPANSGIGNWTEEQFGRALREGKYKGLPNGRSLLPPMPWPNYTELTDDEVSAIFAYLQSIRPVENVVPAAVIAMH